MRFMVKRDGDHRDLHILTHSIPTRRSSDLNPLPNMPKHASSLWTRFDPIEQLGIGACVIYQGKRYAATDNQVAMPGYTRSEEHTSELQSLMRISYAVFCLKKKK